MQQLTLELFKVGQMASPRFCSNDFLALRTMEVVVRRDACRIFFVKAADNTISNKRVVVVATNTIIAGCLGSAATGLTRRSQTSTVQGTLLFSR